MAVALVLNDLTPLLIAAAVKLNICRFVRNNSCGMTLSFELAKISIQSHAVINSQKGQNILCRYKRVLFYMRSIMLRLTIRN